MNDFVRVFGPVFLASFALQQLIELLEPLLEMIIKKQKKWILSAVSLAVGLFLSFGLGLRVLRPFGFTRMPWVDGLLTALILTGGTQWVNDLLKIFRYKKQELRVRAAAAEKA